MPLSDAQIERYSRQIIVPGLGGRGQERLLASRLLLVAALEDAREPLAYMAGAGVGTVHLHIAADDAATERLCAAMRALNPEVAVIPRRDSLEKIDLVLALVGSASVLDLAGRLRDAELSRPSVFARLDPPARVAVLANPPPCARCAAEDLFAPFGMRLENAGFVAMVAAAEALKILAGYGPCAGPSMIEFDAYRTTTRILAPRNSITRCACAQS